MPRRSQVLDEFQHLTSDEFAKLVADVGGRIVPGYTEVVVYGDPVPMWIVCSARISWEAHTHIASYHDNPGLEVPARGPRWSRVFEDCATVKEASRNFADAVAYELWVKLWWRRHPKVLK